MARLEQQPERMHEARDVIEVQTGRRLIEDQELAARAMLKHEFGVLSAATAFFTARLIS